MSDCKNCFHACVCKKRPMIDGATIVNCRFFITDEPQTNADRIRAMSDEELAEFLEGEYGNFATGCALAWLKQPAKEGE